MEPAARRTFRTGTLDVAATVRTLGLYPGDPTIGWSRNSFSKAVLTPDGPGAMRLWWTADGETTAEAWGSGADWLIDRAPDWIGEHDDLGGFDPTVDDRIHEMWRRHGRFRLARGGVIWQELALVLLGQRVTTLDAVRSWAQICRRWGGPAPGPDGLLMPPPPARVAAAPYHELHRMGVERRRADALVLAAKRANRLEEAASMPIDAALERLTALPGLGVWSATSTMTVSHGDPDVIVLGDYGIPTMVNYVFTGEVDRLPPEEGGDARMAEHLEPWAGHRQRIIRLLFSADVSVPRRHPKSANPDIRRL